MFEGETMEINTRLTESQRGAIAQYQAQEAIVVTSVNRSFNPARVAMSCSTDPESLSAFTYTLYVGKRGRIYETESGDY